MKTINSRDEDQDSRDPLHGINAALLRSEIGFWQEMINSSDKPPAPVALERMEQALALAESRLKSLFRNHQHPACNNTRTQSNVYSISRHRA